MNPGTKKNLAQELSGHLTTWATSTGDVLGQILGKPVGCACQEPSSAVEETSSDSVWLVAALTGKLSGELAFRLPSAGARCLAQLFVGDQQDGQADLTPEHREALVELFRQIAGRVATNLKADWGEIKLAVDAAPTPTWSTAATVWMQVETPTTVVIEVLVSAALFAGLCRTADPAAETIKTPDTPDAKLGMLLDVELLVTLRFGGKRMLLKDILDLCAGSVVELDQRLQEPVELLLDGKLLARGEVVVVDGNYGLRVLELAAAASQ